jgi:hypothetical protein
MVDEVAMVDEAEPVMVHYPGDVHSPCYTTVGGTNVHLQPACRCCRTSRDTRRYTRGSAADGR